MDYKKLDADLIARLGEAPAEASERGLSVFIQTEQPPGPEEESFLKEIGLSDVAGRELFTATLSPGAIDKLSSQPWVRYLKLARTMRQVDET